MHTPNVTMGSENGTVAANREGIWIPFPTKGDASLTTAQRYDLKYKIVMFRWRCQSAASETVLNVSVGSWLVANLSTSCHNGSWFYTRLEFFKAHVNSYTSIKSYTDTLAIPARRNISSVSV